MMQALKVCRQHINMFNLWRRYCNYWDPPWSSPFTIRGQLCVPKDSSVYLYYFYCHKHHRD